MTQRSGRLGVIAVLALGVAFFAACGGGELSVNGASAGAAGQSAGGSAGVSGSGGSGAAGGQADPCKPREADILPTPPRRTPRWAFEPWISKDISDDADTREFVKGFEDRDIPVGVVVLDSPWETHYNTFVPNPSRYPDFDKLVSHLRAKDIRIVLWVTQMVNTLSFDLEMGGDSYKGESPNFEEGLSCGFFVNDGEAYPWWKGKGAGVDFFNPQAATWWHVQQDPLFELGVNGWKLDFGEEYLPDEDLDTFDGKKSRQLYSEAYYRDFYRYGVSKQGDEFVTMVRPYDRSYGFKGRTYARPEDAPVAWVGDNRRDWVGLADALDHIFRSAQLGYVVIGSDIGGYLDRDDEDFSAPVLPFDSLVFARWTALGAMTPFMQLHGRANITPWTVPDHVDETVLLYRYWSKLHHSLVPFYYSIAQETYAGHRTMIAPLGTEETWPGDYRFLLGDTFLVAPILDETGQREVVFPEGARWYNWWDADSPVYEPGTSINVDFSNDRSAIPLYVREGAIIPMTIEDNATNIGDYWTDSATTWLIFPSDQPNQFTLHEADDKLSTLDFSPGDGQTTLWSIHVGRSERTSWLRIRHDGPLPSTIAIDGETIDQIATTDDWYSKSWAWWHEESTHSIWVKVPPSNLGRMVNSLLLRSDADGGRVAGVMGIISFEDGGGGGKGEPE